MSSGESEYETAEEGGDSDGEENRMEREKQKECGVYTYNEFFIYVAEDGTRWFLPVSYRAELDLCTDDMCCVERTPPRTFGRRPRHANDERPESVYNAAAQTTSKSAVQTSHSSNTAMPVPL